MMLKTGIPKLDELLGGGVPAGKSLLFFTQPGIEGDVFGMQTLYNALTGGLRAAYVLTMSPPYEFFESMRELGWEVSDTEHHLLVIDGYSKLIGMDSKAKYVVDDPYNIENFDAAVRSVLEESDALFFSSLSDLMDMCGEVKTLESVRAWLKLAAEKGVPVVANFTAWPYDAETLEGIKEAFNAVVKIAGIAERIIIGQYYSVTKADWVEAEEKALLFKVVRPGGVRAYIPKILVTGPYNAGKSTFVGALSKRAVSVDRFGTTVALDHGYVDYKGVVAEVFGTPGQERFDPLLKWLGGESMGVFLVVDSTDAESFPRARKMLEMTRASGLPCVVVANKQDLPGALSPEEIRKQMRLEEDVPVIPAVATERKGVFEAFETLVERIMGI
ncbi:MAG: GTP-binding protein [Candidatus Alkanophagales archaeon]|nr:MAG: GTP-binding protein [Candidatus Alkanophagales archaeon]